MNNFAGRKFYIFRVTMVVSVGDFLSGYDGVIIAGALPFLTTYFHLSPAMCINSPTHPKVVRLIRQRAKTGAGQFKYIFPAHSITVIKLKHN
jgi:hypothetical protein